jgi:hypothetical protein
MDEQRSSARKYDRNLELYGSAFWLVGCRVIEPHSNFKIHPIYLVNKTEIFWFGARAKIHWLLVSAEFWLYSDSVFWDGSEFCIRDSEFWILDSEYWSGPVFGFRCSEC